MNLTVLLWMALSKIGKKVSGTSVAIYGFDGGNIFQRLAGKIFMSRWWPYA